MAQRRQLHRAREEPQQLGQVAAPACLRFSVTATRRSCCRLAALASCSALASACSCRAFSGSTCLMTSVPSPSSSSPAGLGQPVLARRPRPRPARGTARPGCAAGAPRGPGPACRRRARPPAPATPRRRRPPPPGGSARSHSAPLPTRPGRYMAGLGAGTVGRGQGRGSISFTCTTPPASGPSPRDPAGSTSGPRRRWAGRPSPRPGCCRASASVAWPSSTAWSPGSSTCRA